MVMKCRAESAMDGVIQLDIGRIGLGSAKSLVV